MWSLIVMATFQNKEAHGQECQHTATLSIPTKPLCCALMSVENSLFGWKSGEPNVSHTR